MFKNQLLLSFANTRLGKRIIALDHQKIEGEVVKVTHNSYHVFKGFKLVGKQLLPIFEAKFYPDNLIAERLFPIGRFFHAWDTLFANRYAPSLNLGFDTFTSNTGEGRSYAQSTVWATVRANTVGLAADAFIVVQSDLDAGNYNINRSFFPIDTSSLPNDANVTSATFKAYRDDAVTAFGNVDSTSLHIVTQTQASNTALVAEDYDQVSFTSKGSITFASTSNNAYTSDITITDLTIISLTGHTKIALITGRDQADSAPTGINTIAFQGRGGANPPTLTVTYSLGGGAVGYKSLLGVGQA